MHHMVVSHVLYVVYLLIISSMNGENMSQELTSNSQMDLPNVPVKIGEVDGINMGVLSDGTPFLSARGVSRLVGQAPSSIITLVSNWDEERLKPRGAKISQILREQGIDDNKIHVEVTLNGVKNYAIDDAACLAILEYYAFDSTSKNQEVAQTNYRLLARRSIREFVYTSLGYDPANVVPVEWKHFHDRMLLNEVPRGYFSVFKEIADLMVSSIRQGLVVDEHVVPDISVGQAWSKHWETSGFDDLYGQRTKHPHHYPDYFPQSKNGPVSVFIYPLASLGEFRSWFEAVYLQEKFKTYISGQIKKKAISVSSAELLLEAVTPNEITKH
ncbi:hypothetical protein CGK13_06280 [Vibrio parahaemolyticus]|nr:hypothetical protein CGK13_06280 [Vibrio parahaemolyticus]